MYSSIGPHPGDAPWDPGAAGAAAGAAGAEGAADAAAQELRAGAALGARRARVGRGAAALAEWLPGVWALPGWLPERLPGLGLRGRGLHILASP